MYSLYRKIHLYSGLIILIYLMMFYVSGYVMTHRPWFLGPPKSTTTRTVVLEPGLLRLSNEQLAANLQKQLGLAGGIQFPLSQPPNLIRFFVIRPGTTMRVDVSTQDKLVRVITQRYGWAGTLIVLHKVEGYHARNGLLSNASVFFGDLAALSMIAFAISGVILWWKRSRNHFWGAACLIASCAYAAGIMLYFAYAP